MVVADVRLRAVHVNGSGGDAMVGLRGTQFNGSSWEPPAVPDAPLPDADPVWLPAAHANSPTFAPDEFEAERSRLEAEISTVKSRAVAARRLAPGVHATLHAEVIAAQDALAEMERQHGIDIASIREAARVEVARILSEARQQVARGANGPTGSGGHQ